MKYVSCELNGEEILIVNSANNQVMYTDRRPVCWLRHDDATLAEWVKNRN